MNDLGIKEIRSGIENSRKGYQDGLVANYLRVLNLKEDIKRSLSEAEELLISIAKDHQTLFGVEITSLIEVTDIEKDFVEQDKNDVVNKQESLEQEPDTENKFWKQGMFMGWSAFILERIKEENRFLSLSNLIQFCKPDDNDEATTLTSSISSTLSTIYQRGLVGRIRIQGKKGYYVGLPEFFTEDSIKPEYYQELCVRFNVESFTIEQLQIGNTPVTING